MKMYPEVCATALPQRREHGWQWLCSYILMAYLKLIQQIGYATSKWLFCMAMPALGVE